MKDIKYEEINERAFDILSRSYEKRKNKNKQDFEETIRTFISNLLTNFNMPIVLEIGPGAGIALNIFEKRGIKTTAIDISLKMINLAQESSPKTEYINNNFLAYDFRNKIFQGVFARSVFHLFPINKSKEFLEKVHSILDKNGIFYLSVPLYNRLNEGCVIRHFEDESFSEFRVRYNRNELIRNISNSGLYIIYKEDISPLRDTNEELVSRLELLLKKSTC